MSGFAIGIIRGRLSVYSQPLSARKSPNLLLAYGSVCGTDLDIIRAHRPEAPQILGHEGIAISTDSSGLISSTVVFNPVSGRNQDDILGHRLPGIWRSEIPVSRELISGNHIVPISGVSEPQPWLAYAEPAAAAIYACDIALGAETPGDVVILGSGSMGCLIAAELRHRKANRITMIGRRRQAVDWALRHGFCDFGFAVNEVRSAKILPSDTSFIAVPRTEGRNALSIAASLTRQGGLIDLVSAVGSASSSNADPLIELCTLLRRSNVAGNPRDPIKLTVNIDDRSLTLTGHRGTSSEHILLAVERLGDPKLLFKALLTHIVPARESPPIIEQMSKNRSLEINGKIPMKIVLDFTDS